MLSQNRKLIKFDTALDLVEEADILLFRSNGYFSSYIRRLGEGNYSHVGLATWHNGKRRWYTGESMLEITEFKEWKGGRTVDLATAYKKDIIAGNIDVYRVNQPLIKWYYDKDSNEIKSEEVIFNSKDVTNYLRSLTGLPYGWAKIWWIFQHKLFRLFYDFNISNDYSKFDPEAIYPVCSTAVAASFSKYGYDLTHNLADEWVEPSAVSRSALCSYLFTLTK
jgi:hypothetical protein